MINWLIRFWLNELIIFGWYIKCFDFLVIIVLKNFIYKLIILKIIYLYLNILKIGLFLNLEIFKVKKIVFYGNIKYSLLLWVC